MPRVVVVHGGVDAPRTDTYRAMLEHAAAVGKAALRRSCLDAVEEAIRVMEDAPEFNAGYGAVFNRAGVIELDALIVDGRRGRSGAVAALRDTPQAITVARRVLADSPYVLLAGAGATSFAVEQGIPQRSCATDDQRRAWEAARRAGTALGAGLSPFTGQPIPGLVWDTVGAVATDGRELAAGSATRRSSARVPSRHRPVPRPARAWGKRSSNSCCVARSSPASRRARTRSWRSKRPSAPSASAAAPWAA